MFVKVIHLPQFRAASFHVKESKTPEHDAWAQMKAWAAMRGLFDNPTAHQIYGRNNPTPMDQSILRGYEFWVTIPDDYPLDSDVSEVHFPGGLYAVAACKDEGAEIERTNKLIHEWIARSGVFAESPQVADENARYDMGHIITPHDAKDTVGYHQMDLFVPVVYRNR